MNEDTVEDLKQFIAMIVSQQTSELVERLDKVETKIDELSASVADAIETTNNINDAQLKDHQQRIIKLEHKTA